MTRRGKHIDPFYIICVFCFQFVYIHFGSAGARRPVGLGETRNHPFRVVAQGQLPAARRHEVGREAADDVGVAEMEVELLVRRQRVRELVLVAVEDQGQPPSLRREQAAEFGRVQEARTEDPVRLVPLVVPLAWAVMSVNGMTEVGDMHILYSSVSCVLAGAVWGDHCSPISDTTVLSSIASGCNHIEHVRTQLPYALLLGLVALVVGFTVGWAEAGLVFARRGAGVFVVQKIGQLGVGVFQRGGVAAVVAVAEADHEVETVAGLHRQLAGEGGTAAVVADMDAAVRTIAGTARSMGLDVEGVE